jgi:GT2 family glycosyltransferase
MAETPRVSVVMPVHNGGEYLARAIESILSQTMGDFELVIVNDGSTDATAATLQAYQSRDRRVRVHHEARAGLVASLNRGCRDARARYIARMDADDVAFPDRLARQAEFLDQHPRVAVIGSAVVRIDGAGRELKRSVSPTSHADIIAALKAYTPFTHPTVTFRAEAFAAVGRYRSAYGPAEDYDLWVRLSERYELANLAEPLLYYRVYPGQVSVRQLEQQILSVVGARAAAEQRRRTGHDQTPADRLITRELLREWGVPDATLAEAMAAGYRYAAYTLQESGQPLEAIEVLRIGRRLSRGHATVRQMLAGACAKQARAELRRGRLVEAMSLGIEALRVRPRVALELWRAASRPAAHPGTGTAR